MRKVIDLATGMVEEHDSLPSAGGVPDKNYQISVIESHTTQRWLRAAILGDAYALSKLQEIEDQIEIIRNS